MPTKKVKCPKCKGKGTLPEKHSQGCQFQSWRKKSGLSLAEAARKMGISEGHLCKLENGQREWTQENVRMAEQVFK